MARDGSTGTYTRAVPPYIFDTIIDETAVNSEMDDIAAALTQSVSKDGQTTMTGNLKMGGNKLTNAGDASVQNEYATAGQVQKGTASYLLSIGGTANAITAVAAFSMAAYTAGQQFIFVPTANNSSTTPTININAIGALTIKRDASAALVANDIVSGRPAKLYYNGTDMILLNPATVAASQLQVNSVATASIQDNAVTTAKINDKAVTLAKMADLAASKLIGRATASTGVPEAVGLDSTLAMDAGNLKVVPASEAQAGAVEILADSEFAAGTDAQRAMVVSNFGKSISANGYIKLPGGLILQWGKTAAIANTATITVTFPLAFVTAAYSVQTTVEYQGSGTSYSSWARPISTSQMSVGQNNGASAAAPVFWLAVGV